MENAFIGKTSFEEKDPLGELVIAHTPRSLLYANEEQWTTPITMPGRHRILALAKKDCKLFTFPRRVGFTMEKEKGDST